MLIIFPLFHRENRSIQRSVAGGYSYQKSHHANTKLSRSSAFFFFFYKASTEHVPSPLGLEAMTASDTKTYQIYALGIRTKQEPGK